MAQGKVFLGHIAQKRLRNHPAPGLSGNVDRTVSAMTVHDHNVIGKHHRGQTPGQILFLIVGDDTDAQGSGTHCVPFSALSKASTSMAYTNGSMISWWPVSA